MISKLTLGTAQLGLKYGIANINGKPNFNTSIDILNFAWENGINSFDTSPAYGNSEEIIGSFIFSHIQENSEKPVIISKLPEIKDKNTLTYDNLYSQIKIRLKETLGKLNIVKIPFYLMHNPADIFFKNGIVIDCLAQLKSEGLIDNIGISVYNPDEVSEALKFKELNAIQVPVNLFDNRLINLGLLNELKKNNYTIFARSIFLQGLFFKRPEELSKKLEIARNPLNKLINIANKNNIDIASIALLYVRDIPDIDSLVIGHETITQISENLTCLKQKPLSREIKSEILEEFSEIPERILNPSLWND